jgi:hypothetical protein
LSEHFCGADFFVNETVFCCCCLPQVVLQLRGGEKHKSVELVRNLVRTLLVLSLAGIKMVRERTLKRV